MAVQSLSTSGIVNFARYKSMLVGNDIYNPGSFYLIETTILSSDAPSFTFSNLENYAADYKHLHIKLSTRTNRGSLDYLRVTYNGDGESNYSFQHTTTQGSTVSAYSEANTNRMDVVRIYGGATTNYYSGVVIDILDPFSSNKKTTMRSLGGPADSNMGFASGVWNNTSPISSISFNPGGGSLLMAKSRFSIYGIKG